MELKMAFHSTTRRRIVEVFDNMGRFVAAIYPDEEINGIKIVSKHFSSNGIDVDDGRQSLPPVPAVTVQFSRDFEV